MPSAADIAANKAKSQARQIVLALRLKGHKNADIARAIGAEASAVQRIVKGDTPGDALLPALLKLANQVAGAGAAALPAPKTPAEPPAAPNEAPDLAASLIADAPDAPQGGSLPADLAAIEAPAPDAAPKPTGMAARLKAMMLGGEVDLTAPKAKASAGKGAEAQRGAFVAQVLPIVALGTVMACDVSIKDPYKPVGPTQAEAEMILREPVKLIARELDVRGKLTENTMALLITLVAVAAYANRARGTYRQIKAEQIAHDTRARNDATIRAYNADAASRAIANGYAPGGHGGPGAAASDNGHGSASGGAGSGGQRPDASAAPGRNGRSLRRADAGGTDQPAPGGADQVAAILAADYEGRVQRGML